MSLLINSSPAEGAFSAVGPIKDPPRRGWNNILGTTVLIVLAHN
jgi:hypothetical protein